jgi:hypothetical protein
LGPQAEARSAIIGSFGTELDAQKEFLKQLEDSINQHADIPTSIARYQKSISDTHAKIDNIIAPGLFIIGSDMILKVGIIENYNNNILIPRENMKPGKNNINNKKNIPPPLMKRSKPKVYTIKAKHETPILKSVQSFINNVMSTKLNTASTKVQSLNKDEIKPEIKRY